MAEKDKSKEPTVTKAIPKDGQVIMAIIKEMGITDYDPKTIIQLTEFVYRYASTVLEDARGIGVISKKKIIDIEDVRTALQLSNESMFISTPPREVLTECSRIKNNVPLPSIKSHCGLRIPADRFCLTSTNYIINSNKKSSKSNGVGAVAGGGIKIVTKPTVSYIKRTTAPPLAKQTVTVPKPLTNIMVPKTVPKPKIQIQQNNDSLPTVSSMEIENSLDLKRKREDDENL